MSTSEALSIAPAPASFQSNIAAQIANASNEELQVILAAAVRAYGERSESADFAAFPSGAEVTATDVMVTATAMLQAAGLQLFELGMWQAWSGKY